MSDRDYIVTTDGWDDKPFGSITVEELEAMSDDEQTTEVVVDSGHLPVEFDDLGSMGHVGPEVEEE